MSEATRGGGGRKRVPRQASGESGPARRRRPSETPAPADGGQPAPPGAFPLRVVDPARYAALRLPLTAALIRAGLGGLSMSTPGHRGGRLFGAWEAPRDAKRG